MWKKACLTKGFTLIELLIVVAIIAILAVIAVPNLMRTRINANHSFAKATLKAIATALDSYLLDRQAYPSDVDDLIGESPPYLSKDYFDGQPHSGYIFVVDPLTDYDYTITATPSSPGITGTKTFTLIAGSKIAES